MREEIKDFQFSAGYNGIANAQLVARINGITETTEIKHTVSDSVNKVANNGPQLAVPISITEPETLF